MGSLGEEVPSGSVGRAWALGALKHDQALPLVEVVGERGEVELGEEGPLQGGVDAVHGAELPLLHLMVQQPAVARRVHLPAPENSDRPSSGAAIVASPPLGIADSSRGIEERNETEERGKGKGSEGREELSAFGVGRLGLGGCADAQRRNHKQQ